MAKRWINLGKKNQAKTLVDFIDLQISLSHILRHLEILSAGIWYFHELFNTNKTPSVSVLKNFFIVQEIYGSQGDQNLHDGIGKPNMLVDARMQALNHLEKLLKSFDEAEDKIRQFKLKRLEVLVRDLGSQFRTILVYWQCKLTKKAEAVFCLTEPKINQIGHLIPLSCGHNGKIERCD